MVEGSFKQPKKKPQVPKVEPKPPVKKLPRKVLRDAKKPLIGSEVARNVDEAVQKIRAQAPKPKPKVRSVKVTKSAVQEVIKAAEAERVFAEDALKAAANRRRLIEELPQGLRNAMKSTNAKRAAVALSVAAIIIAGKSIYDEVSKWETSNKSGTEVRVTQAPTETAGLAQLSERSKELIEKVNDLFTVRIGTSPEKTAYFLGDTPLSSKDALAKGLNRFKTSVSLEELKTYLPIGMDQKLLKRQASDITKTGWLEGNKMVWSFKSGNEWFDLTLNVGEPNATGFREVSLAFTQRQSAPTEQSQIREELPRPSVLRDLVSATTDMVKAAGREMGVSTFTATLKDMFNVSPGSAPATVKPSTAAVGTEVKLSTGALSAKEIAKREQAVKEMFEKMITLPSATIKSKLGDMARNPAPYMDKRTGLINTSPLIGLSEQFGDKRLVAFLRSNREDAALFVASSNESAVVLTTKIQTETKPMDVYLRFIEDGGKFFVRMSLYKPKDETLKLIPMEFK